MPERIEEAKLFAQQAMRWLHCKRCAPRFGRTRRLYSLAKRSGLNAAV